MNNKGMTMPTTLDYLARWDKKAYAQAAFVEAAMQAGENDGKTFKVADEIVNDYERRQGKTADLEGLLSVIARFIMRGGAEEAKNLADAAFELMDCYTEKHPDDFLAEDEKLKLFAATAAYCVNRGVPKGNPFSDGQAADTEIGALLAGVPESDVFA